MPVKLIIKRIQKIYSYRRSLWSMSLKQFKAKYAGSVLGFFWVIINPLLMMLVITFVFTAVFKTGVKDFALFVLSGILPWMFFSGALSEATPSLLVQKSVLHQFSLPKEILPLSSVLSYFMSFLMSWCIVYPVFSFHNPKIIPLTPLLPVIFLLTYFFTCGISLLFSVINILFRDLEHLLGILLMFWFWVTPVFYSIEMIPPEFRWAFNFNPMSPFIICYREIILYGRIPDVGTFLGVIGWAFFSLFIGLSVSVCLESSALKRI
ncbi:MAG: ABC transporter permease [Candidatus Omnitrophota bacterium]